jgi:hypothetical protein
MGVGVAINDHHCHRGVAPTVERTAHSMQVGQICFEMGPKASVERKPPMGRQRAAA